MRATVSISDELFAAAIRRARERGQTLDEVVDAALWRDLSESTRGSISVEMAFAGVERRRD